MRVESPMVVDCDTCPVRGLRCDDCVVTALGHLPVTCSPTASCRSTGRSGGPSTGSSRPGLVTPDVADTLVARREPWSRRRPPSTERSRERPQPGRSLKPVTAERGQPPSAERSLQVRPRRRSGEIGPRRPVRHLPLVSEVGTRGGMRAARLRSDRTPDHRLHGGAPSAARRGGLACWHWR